MADAIVIFSVKPQVPINSIPINAVLMRRESLASQIG